MLEEPSYNTQSTLRTTYYLLPITYALCPIPYFCIMASNPNKVMLGLRLPTDPRWVNIVEKDIAEILTDHAYCEQKAASNAISCIVKYPEYSDVVDEMVRICNEEMTHFGMVHDELKKRGLTLGRERKDPYVHDLMDFIMKGGGSREAQFVDRMLFAAMIEARSCERFRLLSEEISDEELREFYRSLMESEAEHYATFIGFARKYAGTIDVDTRWKEFLEYEATLMGKYGKGQTMHG
jgi:tRNA 2-(methylsulfanyl)-N6-isopentenyladenosine37 hydroxylase